jgi:hypothetical protein
MIEALILAAQLWVGPAQSGSWFTPERSGEGFTLQVLEDGGAVALWFTYPPAGQPGTQAWIYADGGVVEGDRIRFTRAFTTRGPRFGATYDANALVLEPWGTLEFRFTACNDAEVTFAGPSAWGSGTRRLARLTHLAELECGGKRKVGAGGARALEGLRGRSGSWFDPAHNGEGWTVEELPDGRALVYWFTYDADGRQAWTVGEAPQAGSRIVVEQNLRPAGARFGAAFDPAQVQRAHWGRLEIDFDGCNGGTARYASADAAFGSGTLRPVRLSSVAGIACVDGTPSVPANGTWSRGADMPQAVSEMATAVSGSSAYVIGGFPDYVSFMRYDMASNTWESLARTPNGRHHGIAVAIGGEVIVTGGFGVGGAARGARYSVGGAAWSPDEALPPAAASGGARLGGYAWFGDLSGALWQLDPRTGHARQHFPDFRAPRDHSQVVAFQGELWMIGGRSEGSSETAAVSIFDPASERWRAGPPMLAARAGFAAAATSTALVVAGGEIISGNFRTLTSVESIAAGQQGWSSLPPLPTAVHGVGGATHGNAFFALGGSTRAANATNTPAVQVYRW